MTVVHFIGSLFFTPKSASHSALYSEPFMLFRNWAKAEISDNFERNGFPLKVHLTTWGNYAVMSAVEGCLGINMLPELILKRIPYCIIAKETDVPAYGNIRNASKG